MSLGAYTSNNTGTASQWFNGEIFECGRWLRLVSDDEIGALEVGEAIDDTGLDFWVDFEDADSFPGEVTGGYRAVDGSAEILAYEGLFWPDDGELFWRSDDSLFWDTNYKQLIYETTFTPDLTDPGTGLTYDNPALTIDLTTEGGPHVLYYWSGGAWRAWPGKLEAITEQEYRFKLMIPGGTDQGKITGWTFRVGNSE